MGVNVHAWACMCMHGRAYACIHGHACACMGVHVHAWACIFFSVSSESHKQTETNLPKFRNSSRSFRTPVPSTESLTFYHQDHRAPRDSSDTVCMRRCHYHISEGGVTGVLLFAVCRGKVSEGIDFTDNNARAVITVSDTSRSIIDVCSDASSQLKQ